MIQALVGRLDLAAALRAATSNDLLPPRHDDKVGGEVGKRFIEYLRKQIADGAYEPDSASFVQVPKAGLTSRPAALLTLTDRVVYEALVNLLRSAIAKCLMEPDIAFWPRESDVPKRWQAFEKAPLVFKPRYVVQADVAGFYESIGHEQLEDDLVRATGDRIVAEALRAFLTRAMGAGRGVPQGLLPSDALATLYLQTVDATMIRDGFNYCRHGDDMRVAVDTISLARDAIARLEHELRGRGLLLNVMKLAIVTSEQYDADLKGGETAIRAMKKDLFETKVDLLSKDRDELMAAMNAKLHERWGWDLFYHGTVSLDDVIEELRPHLTPTDAELAEHVFFKTLERAPGRAHALPKEQFHFLITRSLIQLAAARSAAAVASSASIVARFPDKTEIVCHYLHSIVEANGSAVVKEVENLVKSDLFMTPWQQAWLYRVLGAGAAHVGADVANQLRDICSSDAAHWLPRVEAMKVLSRVRRLDRDVLTRCWRLAPRPYRCDMLEAAAHLLEHEEWARKFVAAARLDPVEKVVAFHLKQDIATD